MPVVMNTPFGQRVQSDPRDQVAARNFAIMQQLSQLSGSRDAAQIEANARLQAAEADAAHSRAWMQQQQSMQENKLAAQERMAQLSMDREDMRYNRSVAEREADPANRLNALKLQLMQTAMQSAGTPEGRPVYDPASGSFKYIQERALPQSLLQEELPSAISLAQQDKPMGPGIQQPGSFSDIVGDAITSGGNPAVSGVWRDIGNAVFGKPADIAALRDNFNARVQFYMSDVGGPYSADDARRIALSDLRRDNVPQDLLDKIAQ